jgi:CrcB protein
MVRHGVNLGVTRAVGGQFPWGIALINVTGSTLMGVIAGYFALRGDTSQSWRLFLTTGILGGYTTFSAFSLDAAVLYQRGEPGLAVIYVVGSVGLSLAGLFAGLALMRALG